MSSARDSAPEAAEDTTLLTPGGPGYRRMSLALLAAGLATFALLYSTQALLPALSTHFNVSAGEASWTVSAATGALALFVLPMSALSERFGRRRLMTVSLMVAVAVGLLTPFVPNVETLVALRAVQGAALAGLPATAMAFLAEEVRPKALVAAIGLFVAGNSIGGMSGRVLTGWVAQLWGWRVSLAVIGVLSLLCAIVFRAMLPAARHFTPRSVSPKSLAKTAAGHFSNPLLVRLYLVGGLFMVVFGAVYTVIGYRLTAAPFHLSQGLAGSVFVIYLVGTVSSATAGRLVKRLGRRGALYTAVALTGTGLLLSLSGALVGVLLGLVLITAGFFFGHSVASSSVSRTAQTDRAQASALYTSSYYIGSSAGGAIGATLFHLAGWGATVGLGLLAVLGVTVITLYGTYTARSTHRTTMATAQQ